MSSSKHIAIGAFNCVKVWMPPLDITDTPNMAVLEAIDAWVNGESKNRSNLEATNFTADWQGFLKNMSHLVEEMEVSFFRCFSPTLGVLALCSRLFNP